ncbi:MAG: DUF1461 domain-containing protein [Clostridia bacterium]|nr:DUF1461 domain-containing protein [Clostridia bacterium]
MKKVLATIYTVLFTLSVFFIFGFIAIVAPSTNTAFYSSSFDRNNTLAKVKRQESFVTDENAKTYLHNMTKDDLLALMHRTMRYCLYLEDDLNPTIDGVRIEVFRETDYINYEGKAENEYNHMADVKRVFGNGMIIVGVSVLVVIGGVVLFLLNKDYYYKNLRKVPFITLAVLFGILAGVGIFALIDFDYAFDLFHMIFFSGGNWNFSYGVMIYMIGDIFTSLVPIIAGVWIGLTALFTVGVYFINKRLKKRTEISY